MRLIKPSQILTSIGIAFVMLMFFELVTRPILE